MSQLVSRAPELLHMECTTTVVDDLCTARRTIHGQHSTILGDTGTRYTNGTLQYHEFAERPTGGQCYGAARHPSADGVDC
jgi:hypothetical protein